MSRGPWSRGERSGATRTVSQERIRGRGAPRAEVRTFAMTIQEARADLSMVTSLVSIYSVDAFILSDSCSAYSHILVDFTQYINKEVD